MKMTSISLSMLLLVRITSPVHASNNPQTAATMQSLNGKSVSTPQPPATNPFAVLHRPLKLHSLSPPTGFHRDGYCRTSPSDTGHHAIAGIVSDEFLDFTASKGNDLRTIPGMKAGCKWCLCTGRWLEAYKAYQRGEVGRSAVPRVVLEATEESVLGRVNLEVLNGFAVKPEDNSGKGQGKGEL
jgi:uncharacterized protein